MNDLITGIPILGLILAIPFFKKRIQIEIEEDAEYERIIKQMGSAPKFCGQSVGKEKQRIAGEIIGHLIGGLLVFICILNFFTANLLVAIPCSYAGSYYGGLLGRYLAGKIFDYKNRLTDDDMQEMYKDSLKRNLEKK